MNATPSDFCACGCGLPAGVYKTSNSAQGIVAGQPKRFIHGHHLRVISRTARAFDERYTITSTGCWQWNKVQDDEDGYGRIWVDGRKRPAHRYSYELAFGPIPDGVHIDHICHDPQSCAGGTTCPHRACVNPAHLSVSSHADNCRRGVLAKLNMEKARDIRRRFRMGETGIALAEEFHVKPTTISMVVRNRTWREVT